MEIAVHKIRNSDNIKARQTAGIFVQYLSVKCGTVESPRLGPVDDVKPIGDKITNNDEHIMLVGHLPFMEHLAGHLITGVPDLKIFDFHNAYLICLTHEKGGWVVDWIRIPEIGL